MGTFAETAIVDYRLSFADQGNKLLLSILVSNRNFHHPSTVCPFVADETNGS
jgi:hypothetical protein